MNRRSPWLRVVGLHVSNLRRFRKAAGLSQEELAHHANLDRTYISGVERGVRNPSVMVLQDLALVLGKRPADLLDESEAVSGDIVS